MIGRLTVFVRTHFCDSACSWCDTKYTWDRTHPDFKKFERLTSQEIVGRVRGLYDKAGYLFSPRKYWLTLSGGNPVLFLWRFNWEQVVDVFGELTGFGGLLPGLSCKKITWKDGFSYLFCLMRYRLLD